MGRSLHANVWKYYVFSFLNQFTIFLPFIVYYFQELGFSLGKIAILQSALAITLFVAEIPSGYVADKIGKKNSLVIGAVLQVFSVLVLYSAQQFSVLIVAHILAGLANAFVSGADSALLYDTLLVLKKEEEYKKKAGMANFFGESAIILSAILGSLIVGFGVRQTILVTCIGYTVLIFVAVSLKEPPTVKRTSRKLKSEFINLFSIIRRSLRNRKLLTLFCYAFVVLGVSSLVYIMYQPYFKATALPLYYYGFVFAAFSVFAAITSLKAHTIENKIGVYWSLVLMPLFLAVALIGASVVFLWFGFAFFFIRELVRGYVFPVLGDYTNRITQSSERATVLSIQSMFSRLGFVIIVTAFGFFSNAYGLRMMFFIAGALMLAFTVVTALVMRKNVEGLRQ